MRRPSKKETEQIIRGISIQHNLTLLQAKVIFDTVGYECLKWTTYKPDNEDKTYLIITTEPKYEEQIKGFRELILRYAKCGEVFFLDGVKEFAFIVLNPDNKTKDLTVV